MIGKINDSMKQLKHYVNNSKRSLYLGTLWVFLLTFFIILVSGMSHGQQHNYHAVELFEPISIHSEQMSVIKRKYNPDNQLFRMDVFIEPESDARRYSGANLEVEAVVRSNINAVLETEVVKVTDHYFTIYVFDVPSNFGTIRLDINSIHGENRSAFVQIYSEEVQIEIDKELQKAENESDLLIDSIRNDIRLVEVEQDENRLLMAENREMIVRNLEEIERLEVERRYQIEAEVNLTNNQIESIRVENIRFDERFEELKEENKIADERIELMEKRIRNVQESSS